MHPVPDMITPTGWGIAQGIVNGLEPLRQTERLITKLYATQRLSSVPSTAVDVLVMSVLVYGLYP
jgi:hypothetical protein